MMDLAYTALYCGVVLIGAYYLVKWIQKGEDDS